MSQHKTIVIDSGSYTCKSGFSGEENPKSIIPTLVGSPKNSSHKNDSEDEKNIYIGNELKAEKDGTLTTVRAIRNGVICNWEKMELIWNYIFSHELKVDPSEYSVLMMESPKTIKINREKMTEVMFETFNVPSFFVGNSCFLGSYVAERNTSVVLECGHEVTSICPQYGGYIIPEGINRENFGGIDLAMYLQALFKEHEKKRYHGISHETLFDIKEKTCYIALDYESELKKILSSTKFNSSSKYNIKYSLPDQKEINICEERIRCPELLFKPYLNGLNFGGIDKMIYDCIMKCPITSRSELANNIFIIGGTSMFNGLKERLENDLTKLFPYNIKANVYHIPEYKYAAWIGGSILSDLPNYKDIVISRKDYDDEGANIVFRKCI